jgi:hypothetical protein
MKTKEEMELLANKICKEELGQEPNESNLSFKTMAHGMNKWEEYRSQCDELPSDEQCDEIAFRKLLLTGRQELQDRALIIDGLQIMRFIASPIIAQLKEENERLKNELEHRVNHPK